MSNLRLNVNRLDIRLHRVLRAASLTALRLALGLVFLGFGVLKFVPGMSPAQDIAVVTTRMLTFDLLGTDAARLLVATLEATIGLCLLVAGPLLRVAMVLLVPQLLGILSPLVLLPDRVFSGVHHAPTLEGQYVLKDVILAAAAMTLATTLRGASLRAPAAVERAEAAVLDQPVAPGTREKLAVVLAGLRGEPVDELCAAHRITRRQYASWRSEVLGAVASVNVAGLAAVPGHRAA